MNNSKVSVCIATYNQAQYIEETIRSVFNQTYPPEEIIVSNDCSTDNTRHILDRLSVEIPNLKVFHQPVNLGIAKNVNFCLRQAKSEFIVRIDSDDILFPSYIFTLKQLLQKYPNAGYAHCAIQEINEMGNRTRVRRLMRKTGFEDGNKALISSVKGYKVAANIIMFRKVALASVNYISTNVNFAEDYYLSASLAAEGWGNVYINEMLACYRAWTDVAGIRVRRKLDEIVGFTKVYNEVIELAFRKKGLSIRKVNRGRTIIACSQASCLGWSVFTKDEKIKIENEIYNLSNSRKTRIYIWIYKLGMGGVINLKKDAIRFGKYLIKRVIA